MKDLGWKLDYARFRIHLREQYGITKAFLFIGLLPEQQALYTRLQEAGFILVFKQLLHDGLKKGNVDVDLTVHTLTTLDDYDGALLVTSDGDFAPLVAYLKPKGKLFGVLSPRRAKCSVLLKRAAAETMRFIGPIRAKVEWK